MRRHSSRLITAAAFVVCSLVVGCESEEAATPTEPAVTDSTDTQAGAASADESGSPPKKRSFAPITLGGDNETTRSDAADSDDPAAQANRIIEKLKPLQVMLGQWRGTTRREFDGFKAVDQHEWVWDLQSDSGRPALVMTSDKSPYHKTARLTWVADRDQFELTVQTPEGDERVFSGGFDRPVEDVPGDDGKLQRTFRLEFTQTSPPEASEQWQLAFHQQENNRYLTEISKRRGTAAFRRIDTVSTQRDGTSFALSDSDYGEKTCIISQGLGTISVSYQGKTYWVCCSGCKAAFEDDPERWIARAAEQSDSE